jgi:hypothetical protein
VVAAGLAGGVALGAAFTITGTGAVSESPHEGQTTHVGSSTIFRQFRQRFGANGSGWPQNGHAATALSMNLSQYGQGCLKVGIVCSYQPDVPEGMDFVIEAAPWSEAPAALSSVPGPEAALVSCVPASSLSSPPAAPICDS